MVKNQIVSITNNPYEGLKRIRSAKRNYSDFVSITNNPYEGLKLANSTRDTANSAQVSITNNPYEGLKLSAIAHPL